MTKRHHAVVAAFAMAIFTAVLRPAVAAEYRLQPGDVIEMSALGVASLSRQTMIDGDGFAVFPLVGSVQASGRTLSDLRKTVGSLLATKALRILTPDGVEYTSYVVADEVTLGVSEFTPVYLSGDIARPGAQPYRPGLTVRQAVAMAGGYGSAATLDESVNARIELEAAKAALIRENVRLTELKALLTDSDPRFSVRPDRDRFASALIALASTRVEADAGEYLERRDYLQSAISKLGERRSVLERQQSEEEEGARLDLQEAQKQEDLLRRGMTTSERQTSARRTSLMSSTRALQTGVQADQADKDRDQVANELATFALRRKNALMSSMQDTLVRIADLEARLRGAQSKVLLSRASDPDTKDVVKEIDIHRRSDEGATVEMAADANAVLMPGDAVEIRFQPIPIPDQLQLEGTSGTDLTRAEGIAR